MPRPIIFELGVEGAEALTSGLRGPIGVLGDLAGAVVTGTQAFRAFALEADRQQAVQAAFTGSIGPARQALQGMASDLQIMEAHNRLANAGLNLSARDLRNVTVAAFQHAEASGGDFNATLDRLGRSIVSGGRGLRQFGIDARAPADALRQLDERFGDAEVSADSLGDRFEQLDVAMENANDEFLEAVTRTGALEESFTTLFNAVTDGEGDFEDAMQSMVDSAGDMGTRVGIVLQRISQHVAGNINGWRSLLSGDIEGARRGFHAAGEAMGSGIGDLSSGRLEHATQVMRAKQRGEDIAQDVIRSVQPGSTGGGGRGRRGSDPFGERETSARLEREDDFAAEMNEQVLDDLRERRDLEIEAYEEIKEAHREMWDEEKEASREREERIREERDLQIEALEKQKAAAREATEQVRDDAMGVLQPVVNGLTDAITDVITGAKSADEAFQGLLASFLEMIAQEAALQAAKEFAEAIASFARYDYSGGAMHIGAGIAYTAVAIAAGAASVAVAPPAAAPASPEQGQAQSGGGEITNVININAGVISSDRAEIGREVAGWLDASDRRYGT